jgi:ABC-2 type transport system ATP-binding protein
MIVVRSLTKRFGKTVAVDDLSFDAQPGKVTGFLGPNGSGKSTSMRCMVGLDRYEHGTATFAGRPYNKLSNPLHEVGILLDAGYVHPARSGRNHLRWLAASNSFPKRRVDEVLELVGMGDVAGKKVKSYSLGMKQRLGLASVLLGDPGTIILDEPANGLDPEGIRWIRDFLKHYASQGRTVLVSSHLLSEMALMADELVVIGRGRLIDQCPVNEFVGRHAEGWVLVRSPQITDLCGRLTQFGATIRIPDGAMPSDSAQIVGVSVEQVGEAAAAGGIVLHELRTQTESLEDAFLKATANAQEYRSGGLGSLPALPPTPPPPPADSNWEPPS